MKNAMGMVMAMALIISAGAALADDFWPLELGYFWSYVSDSGPEMQVITGTEVLLGNEAWVNTYTESPENDGLRNFWTAGPNGEVILHGFARPELGVVYDPPLVYFDPAVPVGGTWTQELNGYAYPAGSLIIQGDLNHQIYETGTLEVPAGTFAYIGFGSYFDPPRSNILKGYRLNGEVAGEDGREVENWISEGVGLIRYALGDLYLDLADYQTGPVSTQVQSFGAVKALFR